MTKKELEKLRKIGNKGIWILAYICANETPTSSRLKELNLSIEEFSKFQKDARYLMRKIENGVNIVES